MVQPIGAIGSNYRYQPDDINTMVTHVDAFGDDVSNAAALFVVSFCKEMRGWVAFSQIEIDLFASKNGGGSAFDFGKLVENGYITKEGDLFLVTWSFIDLCYDKSPSTTGPATRRSGT
jgi:hypothetical protein